MSDAKPYVYQDPDSRTWFVDDSAYAKEINWHDWQYAEFPSWSEAFSHAYTLVRVRNVVADVIGGLP